MLHALGLHTHVTGERRTGTFEHDHKYLAGTHSILHVLPDLFISWLKCYLNMYKQQHSTSAIFAILHPGYTTQPSVLSVTSIA